MRFLTSIKQMANKRALNSQYHIEKDRNVSKIDSVKSTSKSYDYPLLKLVKEIESFLKGNK